MATRYSGTCCSLPVQLHNSIQGKKCGDGALQSRICSSSFNVFQTTPSLLGISSANCSSAWKKSWLFWQKRAAANQHPTQRAQGFPPPSQHRAANCFIMSVLHWQLPSSSSPFSRKAKARRQGAAAYWQRPLLGKQTHINLLCKTSAVVRATLTWF